MFLKNRSGGDGIKKRLFASFIILIGVISGGDAIEPGSRIVTVHGMAMHGQAKYGPTFTHFEYADPNAKKGGSVTFSAIGTFDSLNPFILKGMAPDGIGLLFESLCSSSADEAFSEYGNIAESISFPEDRSWVSFVLRPEAKFHDGAPMTAEDVTFTFDLLMKKGHPYYRAYYASVSKAEKVGERTVKFSFNQKGNRELPLIVGQLPVLSKAYWSTRDFEKSAMEAPLGSGPYEVASVESGRSITYRRVKDWWGAKLPLNRGRFNYDTIKYKFYKDSTVALEAFKAGEYDFRAENSAKSWATGYDCPAFQQGWIKKEKISDENPKGMQGFVMNTRRRILQDRRVRKALAYALDFEWMNKVFFYGEYTRTRSYFEGCELASTGLPKGEELALLKKFKGQIPDEVFTQTYAPPGTDGRGHLRDNLRQAVALLREAGWTVDRGGTRKLVNPEVKNAQGQPAPLAFEILLVDPAFERVSLLWIEKLGKLGIEAKVRTVDSSQYTNRLKTFDFDVIVGSVDQSLSPGNEQRDYWSSAKRDIPGGRNIAGIHDPVVDALVEEVITAPDRKSLVARTHALDRVLLAGHYVIPHWHTPFFRTAYWDFFGQPRISPKYAVGVIDVWWIDPVKAAKLKNR